MEAICEDTSIHCVDNTNHLVQYTGQGWSASNNQNDFNDTARSTAEAGDSVALTFDGNYCFVLRYYSVHEVESGTAVQIYGWWRGGFSTANLTFFLDNQPVGVYENTTVTLNVPSFLLFDSDPFPNGTHTIKAFNYGSFLAIDGFILPNKTPPSSVLTTSNTIQSGTATSGNSP